MMFYFVLCSMLRLYFYFVSSLTLITQYFSLSDSLPSSRHHLSYDDCWKDKTENYHNCCLVYDGVVHNDMHAYMSSS